MNFSLTGDAVCVSASGNTIIRKGLVIMLLMNVKTTALLLSVLLEESLIIIQLEL